MSAPRTQPSRIAAFVLAIALLDCGARTGLEELGALPDAGPPVMPACGPTGPIAETCDGIDNDCNGAVDDGLPLDIARGPVTLSTASDAAVDVELEVTATGMLAMWRVGFRGEMPMPTTHARALTAAGDPLGDVIVPPTRAQVQGPRATPTTRGDLMLAYCGRYGADDHLTSARLSPDARALTGETLRTPGDRSCGAVNPDVLWTGARHLFAWMSNGGGAGPGFATLLDVADETGRSVRNEMLDPQGDLTSPPRMAQLGDRIGMILGLRHTAMGAPTFSFRQFDRGGTAATSPIDVAEPTGAGLYEAQLVAVDRVGWIAIAATRFGTGVWTTFIPIAGSPAPFARLPQTDRQYSYTDSVAFGPGAGIAASSSLRAEERMEIFVVDSRGQVRSSWRSLDATERYAAWPSLAVRDGRLFVAYAASLLGGRYEVRLLEMGCRR